LTQTAILGTLKLMKGEKLILIIVAIITVALIGALVFIGADKSQLNIVPDTATVPAEENKNGAVEADQRAREVINTLEEVPAASTAEDKPARFKANIDYTVKGIDDNYILLEGEKGEMALPKDPDQVKVYVRTVDTDTEVAIAEIKIGDRTQLEIVPGKSAWLYLLR